MITRELLLSWKPCASGFRKFCELFPIGADLKTAAETLAKDGHANWGLWLYDKARLHNLFPEILMQGFMNSGNQNSGNQNSGNQNSGHWNSGNQNSGNWNSGNWNSGHQNNGDWNSGNQNSGDQNRGNQNSGHWNSGSWNSGSWNSGDQNSGCFNSCAPEFILVFNKPCDRLIWESAHKPGVLYNATPTYWVPGSEMTDAEKAADPAWHIRGGCLCKRNYKDAWRVAWDAADPVDRERVRELPNFDAQVFFEITGIDLR